MYNIYNKSEVIYLWDIVNQKMTLIGNDKDLIIFLAKSYRPSLWSGTEYNNKYLDNFACSPQEENKYYQFFDGYNRCINPKLYEKDAWLLYLKKYKNIQVKNDYFTWKKNRTYKGVFRRTPVEGISKWRGGPYCKKPFHITYKWRMFANPEYKDFNRGNNPDKWDEGKPRCNERNWKSQRKHQWKEK